MSPELETVIKRNKEADLETAKNLIDEITETINKLNISVKKHSKDE